MVHQHHHEQGIPVRVGVDDGRQFIGDTRPAKATREIGGDTATAQVFEVDLRDSTPGAQMHQDLLGRVVQSRHLGRAIGSDEHGASALGPLREDGHEIHRAAIAPVQVLQDENDGTLDRNRLQQPRELAGHSLRGCFGVPAAQPLHVRLRLERGHLSQPARGSRAKGSHQPVSHRTLAHPLQGLQHRHVGLPLAVLLDALTVSDQRVLWGSPNGVEKCFDERALADSGLSLNEDDLTLAG